MFKRAALVLLFLPCCVFASEFKKHLERSGGDLCYLQTPEDSKRLGLFSALFDMAEKREKPAGEIPRILHFVWLGPKPFPQISVANIQGWIDNHPGWKIRFWTDLGQNAPDDRMEVRAFDKFPLDELKEPYYRSDNFGERSQILRYAILLSEGGVYVDHDVACLQPIGSLLVANDFFCGMEPLGPTVLSSSVNPSPHLIASTAQHPILKSAKNWLLGQWDRLDPQFPGTDPASIHNRVQHRTFRALSVGIKEAYARAGRKDVVFPPDYFSLSDRKKALYAIHKHEGSWYKMEDPGQLKTHRLLREVKEEFSRTYWMGLSLAALNIGLGVFLVARLIRRQKRRRT
ncbi:MAG: hypothetical protein JSS60_07305 [Verrucomicrobia bacterium]|nr:hypothetical protein [Verrucomicrobiota bacterium]